MRNLIASIAVAAGLLTMVSCGSDEKAHRGLDYIPDMYESPAFKSQQVMPVVLDAQGKPVDLPVMADLESVKPEGGSIHYVPAMLTPPVGTVSRDFVPYPYEAMDFAGPHFLVNPLAPTAAVLKEGQQRFRISCAPCHGNDGDALNSYVGYKFTGIPSLNTPNVAALTEGDIYHIVTSGRNRMPNYRAQLLPEQRWSVVHYVKLLNRSWRLTSETEATFKRAADALAKKPGDAEAKRDFADAEAAFKQAQADLLLIQDSKADWETFVPKPEPMPEYVKPAWPEN
jgi:mono/diheme cytochrome c family protein